MESVFQDVLAPILKGFESCYGLDWLTMFFGVLGGYLMAQKDRRGIVCNIVACSSSFSLALISHQYGFLISNMLTFFIMARAYTSWSSSKEIVVSAKE